MLRKGTQVRWRHGAHEAKGRIIERHVRRVERTLSGSHIVRNASRDNPAYLIEQDDGAQVLKSRSELERAG